MKRLAMIFTGFLFSLSNLYGDEGIPVLQPRSVREINPTSIVNPAPTVKPRVPVRRTASVNGKDANYSKIRVRRRNSGYRNGDTEIHLGLSGGMSGLKSSDAIAQQSRDEQKLGSNIMLGLNADLRFATYLGLELDAYYGIAPTQTIDFGSDDVEKKTLQHYGGMLNIKGQLPFYTGNIRWIPKFGIGYGMLSLKQKTEVASINETATGNETIKGPYGVVGFEVEPIDLIIFSADYAKSLGAAGSAAETTSTTNETLKLDGAAFERLRAGLYFRVDPNILLGTQYIRRSMKSSSVNIWGRAGTLLDISNEENISQFMASILFKF